MRHIYWFFLFGLLLNLMGFDQAFAKSAGADEPVVEVILYWEAGCPACEKVIEEVLPTLQKRYGQQLVIHPIEIISVQDVEMLYQIGAGYGLTKEQIGVPMLLIGDVALVGSEQIPRQLPSLIEDYLRKGGVRTEIRRAPQAELVYASAAEPVWSGMPLAWGLMAFMLIALGYTAWRMIRAFRGHAMKPLPIWIDRSIPVLAVLGLAVAGYLTYVEGTYTLAVCGPVGDCNAVQSSPYARLFGVIPVGLFGMIGYVAILAAWFWQRFRQDRWSALMPVSILGMAVFGTLFSAYLTYLEIFVIRAVCIWCLASAFIITLLMLASLPAATSWLSIVEEDEP